MMIHVTTEEERIPKCIEYIKIVIEDLNREIAECDYIENVNGKKEYFPNAYSDEKAQLCTERYKWQKMYDLLTREAPFSILPW